MDELRDISCLYSDGCQIDKCRGVNSCEDSNRLCPSCGGKVELTGTTYSCTKCNWWEYSSS
jgi:NADH pyrophosphatase NudC (nudix superfamily)